MRRFVKIGKATKILAIGIMLAIGFFIYKHHLANATAASIRQEINILDGVLPVSSTSGAIVQLDTTQYSGTPTYYFEVVTGSASASTDTVTLTRNGTTTNDASISLAGTAANTRVRSTAFTPPSNTKTEYVVKSGANHSIKAARIIVIQSSTPVANTETQIEIGNQETGKTNTTAASLTSPKYWLYTAANWDETSGFYAEVTKAQSAATFNTTVTLQQDDGSFGTWTDLVTILDSTTNATCSSATASTRCRIVFTPTTGRHYRISSLESASTGGKNYSIYNAKIIVDQSNFTSAQVTDLTVSSGSNFVTANDANFVYYNRGTAVEKVSKTNFTSSGTLSTSCSGSSITDDTSYIYQDCGGNINRINKSDFSTQTLITGHCATRNILVDSTYLYCVDATINSTDCVNRIDKTTFSSSTVCPHTNDNSSDYITQDSTYVYYGQGGNGGTTITRILKSDWSTTTSLTVTINNNCYADTSYLFCATPLQNTIDRINLSSFSDLGTITLSANFVNNATGPHGMTGDGTYLYISTVSGIEKIDEASGTIVAATTIDTAAIAMDSNYIFASTSTSTTVRRISLGSSTANITKLEPQYMIQNTVGSATGLQGYPTLWDSTEWSSVTNTYKNVIDSTNASSSAKLQDINNANADVTGSTATGNNEIFSTALTMPTTGHQIDTNITANPTTVTGTRIIESVIISSNSPPATPTLTAPSSGATNVSVTPTFSFSDTDPETDNIQYKISLYQSDCATTVATYDMASGQTGWSPTFNGTGNTYTSGTSVSFTPTSAIADGTTFCWNVSAKDPTGSGITTTSTTRSFTTKVTTFSQNHYRWRNDDGYENTGSSSAGIVRPNADATVAWGVTGSATHFGALAASGDLVTQPTAGSTAEFVSSSTSAQTDTYDMDTLSGSGNYNEVDVWVYAKAATNDGLGVSTNIAGTSQQNLTLTTSNAWYKVSFTGLSVNQTTLDGLRITFTQIKNGGSDTVTVSTMYAEIFNALTAATYSAAQDTVISGVSTGTNVRLRFEIANTDTQAGSPNLSLEYGVKSGTCSGSTYSAVPTTSGSATQMGTSSFFATGDATTTQLTATGTFTTGKMVESASNSTGSISIPNGDYTEVEFVFQGNASAAGNTYCFRLTNSGTALTTYSVYPEISFAAAASGPTTDQVMRGGRWFNNGTEQPFYWAQ